VQNVHQWNVALSGPRTLASLGRIDQCTRAESFLDFEPKRRRASRFMQSRSSAFWDLREIGNRLTGGGLRAMSSRIVSGSARWAMNNRLLLVFGRAILRPFPQLTTRLYKLATKSDPLGSDIISTESASLRSIDLDKLPPSARITYERLRTALANNGYWNTRT
jgi:hypothetical protein